MWASYRDQRRWLQHQVPGTEDELETPVWHGTGTRVRGSRAPGGRKLMLGIATLALETTLCPVTRTSNKMCFPDR
jgi:hypothetical protein